MVPIAAVMGVLLVRNAYLFSTRLYEDADMGANSILIEQARHFSLLVGNYSRLKFNHPGPAFLYIQSWGESLFWVALHVVPTPWNGQLIAVYALNALFAAFVVVVVHGWTRSMRGAAAALAALLLLGALHPPVFSSDWMPYVYVPAFLAFLVAITSVAAGHTLWFWWPHHHAWTAVLVLYAAAAAAAWWCPRGPARRFCWSLIAFDTISTAAMFERMGDCMRRRPQVGIHGDEPVHLLAPRTRARRPVLDVPARAGSASFAARGCPDPKSGPRSDGRRLSNVGEAGRRSPARACFSLEKYNRRT